MKIANRLSELIKLCNTSTKEIATITGQSHSNLLNKLSRDNLRLSEIEEVLNALGYTDIEIVARSKSDTVVITSNDINFKEHTKYARFDYRKTVEDIINEGNHNRKFKDLVLELIEPILAPKFGDLWDTYVPNQFEDGFKAVINKQMSFDDFAENLYTLKTSSHDE